jgi:hypothetical protein
MKMVTVHLLNFIHSMIWVPIFFIYMKKYFYKLELIEKSLRQLTFLPT